MIINEWQSIVADIPVCQSLESWIEINAQVLEGPGGLLVYPQRFAHVPGMCPLLEQVNNWHTDAVVLYVEKSRKATIEAAQFAWSRLPVGARLLLVGPNKLGIKTTAKHISQSINTDGEVLHNKKHARVISYEKSKACEEVPIAWQTVPLDECSDERIFTRYGVFSADDLDEATALLQEVQSYEQPAKQFIDMACGVGHLGLCALRQWPDAKGLLLDADARAMACVEKNIEALQLTQRASAQWWAAGEDIPAAFANCDVVLMNPPAHRGKDLSTADATLMMTQAAQQLIDGGRLYVVANKQLAYEQHLRQLFSSVEIMLEEGRFKIIKGIK